MIAWRNLLVSSLQVSRPEETEIAARTRRKSTSTLTRHIREDAARFQSPCGEKPNRHGGIDVRTRNVSNRVNHRQDDEAKSKCHSHVRHCAAGYAIDDDCAGAGKHQAESSQKFCD